MTLFGTKHFLSAAVISGLLVVSACDDGVSDPVYLGYVEAEYIYAAAPEAGWVMSLPLREGDITEAGQVLFTLDDDRQRALYDAAEARLQEAGARAVNIETGARPEEVAALEAQLSEARAALVLARRERDRWLPLVSEGNASPARGDLVVADFKAAQARVKAAEDAIKVAQLGGRDAERLAAEAVRLAAEAGLAEAAWSVEQRTVSISRSGRIEEIYYREGEYARPGAPVMALLPEGGIKVRFFVPQAELHNFSPGQNVKIGVDGLSGFTSASVTFIATEAEFTPPVIYSADSRSKLVFLVEAKPDDPGAALRPGLPVEVRF